MALQKREFSSRSCGGYPVSTSSDRIRRSMPSRSERVRASSIRERFPVMSPTTGFSCSALIFIHAWSISVDLRSDATARHGVQHTLRTVVIRQPPPLLADHLRMNLQLRKLFKRNKPHLFKNLTLRWPVRITSQTQLPSDRFADHIELHSVPGGFDELMDKCQPARFNNQTGLFGDFSYQPLGQRLAQLYGSARGHPDRMGPCRRLQLDQQK